MPCSPSSCQVRAGLANMLSNPSRPLMMKRPWIANGCPATRIHDAEMMLPWPAADFGRRPQRPLASLLLGVGERGNMDRRSLSLSLCITLNHAATGGTIISLGGQVKAIAFNGPGGIGRLSLRRPICRLVKVGADVGDKKKKSKKPCRLWRHRFPAHRNGSICSAIFSDG